MLVEGRYLPTTRVLPCCTLYLRPTLPGSCLTVLRLLANPERRMAAHITVRGPYKKVWSDYRLEKRIAATRIAIQRLDKFSPGVPIVCFICKPFDLKPIWFDHGSRSFYPHITIYDGDSPSIAKEVHAAIDRYQYRFSFAGSNLMVTKNWGPCLKTPDVSFDQRAMCNITGRILNRPIIESLPFEERLSLIDKICAYLSKQSTMRM